MTQRTLFLTDEVNELIGLVGGTVDRNPDQRVGAAWRWRQGAWVIGFGDTPEEAVDAGLDYLWEDDLPEGHVVPTVKWIRDHPDEYDELIIKTART